MFATPTLARLGAISVGAFLAGIILLLCGLSGIDDLGPLSPISVFIGGFLLIAALIFYVIHLVFTLMRDHEMWKRSLDARPSDRSDDV